VDEVEDGELARRIAAARPGDATDAEAELVRRFAPRVRLYGLRHLRDAPAAEDLVQEVLVTVLERLRAGRLREPDRLASFVLGTSRFLAQADRRGTWRRARLLAEFGEALRPEPAPGPAIDGDRLTDCLGRLPDRDRTLVALTFYAERSGEEIARELGLSPANVRVVRHRVLARLRSCLEAPS
jgi:RNA polymerase sigma-70 factor (ECF subfamily)